MGDTEQMARVSVGVVVVMFAPSVTPWTMTWWLTGSGYGDLGFAARTFVLAVVVAQVAAGVRLAWSGVPRG